MLRLEGGRLLDGIEAVGIGDCACELLELRVEEGGRRGGWVGVNIASCTDHVWATSSPICDFVPSFLHPQHRTPLVATTFLIWHKLQELKLLPLTSQMFLMRQIGTKSAKIRLLVVTLGCCNRNESLFTYFTTAFF
jgi:hypothetical protein